MTIKDKAKTLPCAICGAPAVCIGSYDLGEGMPPEPACDACCGHGCEDGHCEHILDEDGELRPQALEWLRDIIAVQGLPS